MTQRERFEAHWHNMRGKKAAIRELERHPLQPQTYVQDSANRHWVTWQAAQAQAAVEIATLKYTLGNLREDFDMRLAKEDKQQDLRGVSDAQGLPSLATPAQTTGESSGHPTTQAAARVQENERCAKVCEELSPDQVLNPRDSSFFDVTTLACSEAITRLLGKEAT